jgi:hypothetical protein
MQRFMFTALRAREALRKGALVIYDKDLSREAESIGSIVNRAFTCDGEGIRIMHSGELETLALLRETKTNAIMIDERTTRYLFESPERIRDRLEEKLRRPVRMDLERVQDVQSMFSDIEIIRSAELVALAFRRGYITSVPSNPEGLTAALYRVRLNGCSITDKEIQEYPKLVFGTRPAFKK